MFERVFVSLWSMCEGEGKGVPNKHVQQDSSIFSMVQMKSISQPFKHRETQKNKRIKIPSQLLNISIWLASVKFSRL